MAGRTGEPFHRIKPAFGVVTGCQRPDVSSHFPRWRVVVVSGRGAARAEDAQGTPTQSHVSPSILVYEE